jgi:hypothetical protein
LNEDYINNTIGQDYFKIIDVRRAILLSEKEKFGEKKNNTTQQQVTVGHSKDGKKP